MEAKGYKECFFTPDRLVVSVDGHILFSGEGINNVLEGNLWDRLASVRDSTRKHWATARRIGCFEHDSGRWVWIPYGNPELAHGASKLARDRCIAAVDPEIAKTYLYHPQQTALICFINRTNDRSQSEDIGEVFEQRKANESIRKKRKVE